MPGLVLTCSYLQHTSALLVHSARAMESRPRNLPPDSAEAPAPRGDGLTGAIVSSTAGLTPSLLTINRESQRTSSQDIRAPWLTQQLQRGREAHARGEGAGLVRPNSSGGGGFRLSPTRAASPEGVHRGNGRRVFWQGDLLDLSNEDISLQGDA
jgi:hypothetical protein